MNEFALVISEIIDNAKKEKKFNIKEFAEHAGITPSYLSNLKQANRKPPAHKTFMKLIESLRYLGVSENEIKRVIAAYNREQLGRREETNLLGSLVEKYKDEYDFVEKLNNDFQALEALPGKSETEMKETYECIVGDRDVLISKAIQLLEQTAIDKTKDKKIYITWFLQPLDGADREQNRKNLINRIRKSLWGNPSFEVVHLWSGEIRADFSVIEDFVEHYIGTSNCFLYRIPNIKYLPEYFVVEDVGFIEAKPKSDTEYWIRTILIDEDTPKNATELLSVIDYLEYLLSRPGAHHPLVQMKTFTEHIRNSLNHVLVKKLSQHPEELILMKPTFSSEYISFEIIQDNFMQYNFPKEILDTYLETFRKKIEAMEKRLLHGKERAIHNKKAIKFEFRNYLPHSLYEKDDSHVPLWKERWRRQILNVLRVIKGNPNFQFALTDQEFLLHFILLRDMALFIFNLAKVKHKIPWGDVLSVEVFTKHPDVLYQIRHEYEAEWDKIDKKWCTDNEEGKQNVIDFIITESIKGLLLADIPYKHISSFITDLFDVVKHLNCEEFLRELYTHEHVAKEIVIGYDSFPIITMPPTVGPWDGKSSYRIRQHLFSLEKIQKFHLISTQTGVEKYWQDNLYREKKFEPEWVENHLKYFHNILLESPEKINVEILPKPEKFSINFEIIDKELVFLEKTIKNDDEGGILVKDKEFVQEFLNYIHRNFSSKCPDNLKGSKNVAKWLEKSWK